MIKITDSNSMQVNTFSHNIVFGFTKSIIRHYYLNNIYIFFWFYLSTAQLCIALGVVL